MSDPAPVPHLPILATAAESYRLTFANYKTYIWIAWAVLVIDCALMAAVTWQFWLPEDQIETAPVANIFAEAALFIIVPTIAYSIISVGWHRFVLLDERPSAPAYFDLSPKVWRFVAWFLALTVPILTAAMRLIIGIVIVAIDVSEIPAEWQPTLAYTGPGIILFGLVVGLPLLAYIFRFCLIFPSIAIADKRKCRDIWKASRGNTWRIMITSLLVSAPMFLLAAVLTHLTRDWEQNRMWSALSSGLLEVYSLATLPFITTFLTISYRHFFPEHVPPSADNE